MSGVMWGGKFTEKRWHKWYTKAHLYSSQPQREAEAIAQKLQELADVMFFFYNNTRPHVETLTR